MDRPTAHPLRPSAGRYGPRLQQLIEGLSDDDRVVVRAFTERFERGIALDIAMRGRAGFERLVEALVEIGEVVGTDDEGISVEVLLDDGSAEGFSDPDGFPGWALFGVAFQDPDGEAPGPRLLRDVALAAQSHRRACVEGGGAGARRPKLHLVSTGPTRTAGTRVHPDLRALVAAFESLGHRVLRARRTDGVTQFTLAAHDVMGIRSVAGALRRLATAMGKESTEALMECQLLFERNDSPRCDFARYPGWAFFDLELLEVGDGGAFTRSDFDAMAKGVAATKRAGRLRRARPSRARR
jgi:hypothetical protein